MTQSLTQRVFIPALIFLFFLGFYLFTTKGVVHIGDSMVNFQTVRAIVEDRGLAIDCAIPLEEFLVQNSNGRCYSKYDIGLALTSLPLYIIGSLLGEPDPPDIYRASAPKLYVSMFAQFVTAATCALLYILALHISGRELAAFGTAFLYGIATIAWPYAGLYFAQPLIAFLLLLAVTLLLKFPPPNYKALFGVGLALGWACLTRLDTLPLAFVVIMYAFYRLWQSRGTIRQWLVAMLLLGTPILLALLVYLGMNGVRTGSIWQFGYTNEGWTTPFLTGLYGLLFSTGRSIFFYSPLTVVALIGWWGLWRRGWRAETVLVLGLFTTQVATYASWWAWEGGWVWGPRFLVPTQPLLMVGLLPWFTAGWPKWPLVTAAIAGFFVQFIGVTTEVGVYLEATSYTYQETLFKWQASPLLGQLQNLVDGKYSFLLVNRGYGLLSTTEILLWLLVCLVLMFVPLWLLRGYFNGAQAKSDKAMR